MLHQNCRPLLSHHYHSQTQIMSLSLKDIRQPIEQELNHFEHEFRAAAILELPDCRHV